MTNHLETFNPHLVQHIPTFLRNISTTPRVIAANALEDDEFNSQDTVVLGLCIAFQQYSESSSTPITKFSGYTNDKGTM